MSFEQTPLTPPLFPPGSTCFFSNPSGGGEVDTPPNPQIAIIATILIVIVYIECHHRSSTNYLLPTLSLSLSPSVSSLFRTFIFIFIFVCVCVCVCVCVFLRGRIGGFFFFLFFFQSP